MDALDRMFHVLVRTLRAKNPALLTAPFTVGELHSQILPYRHFRRELDLQTNQEYELILMELLAGSRGYLDVDERLRDELGKELASSAPEPSRVRDFMDAQVSVRADAEAKVPEMRTSTPVPTVRTPSQPVSADVPRATPSSLSPAGTRHDSSRCRYCGGDLPTDIGRPLKFCPHCGQNLQVLNCSACGAEVEAGWKFCVACGKGVV